MQVCYKSAKQKDEIERDRYRQALVDLVNCAEQVIVIDETHKDKHSSRQRRAWGKRNSGGVALKRWFRSECHYTMVASFLILMDLWILQLGFFYVMIFQRKEHLEQLKADVHRLGEGLSMPSVG